MLPNILQPIVLLCAIYYVKISFYLSEDTEKPTKIHYSMKDEKAKWDEMDVMGCLLSKWNMFLQSCKLSYVDAKWFRKLHKTHPVLMPCCLLFRWPDSIVLEIMFLSWAVSFFSLEIFCGFYCVLVYLCQLSVGCWGVTIISPKKNLQNIVSSVLNTRWQQCDTVLQGLGGPLWWGFHSQKQNNVI